MISTLILKTNMLKISTFNIQNNFSKYIKSKSAEIIKYVEDNEIDILGLQEVFPKCSKDLREELKFKRYNMFGRYRFFTKVILDRFNEKVPVITDKKVLSYKTYHLPSFPSPLKRIVTKVVILYEDKMISIYNTHLDYLMDSVKKRELKKLIKLIKKDSNLIILMGDFNLKNNKAIFNDFERLLKEENIYRVELNEKTLKNSKYKREIDHIFLSKEIKLVKKEVIKSIDISDHYPVLVCVEV